MGDDITTPVVARRIEIRGRMLHADGLVRTPDEDDGLLVLVVSATPDLDPTMPITCEARPGDDRRRGEGSPRTHRRPRTLSR